MIATLKKEAAERYQRIISLNKNLPFEIIKKDNHITLTISDTQSLWKIYSEEEIKDFLLLISAVNCGLITVDFDLLLLRKLNTGTKRRDSSLTTTSN